MRTVPAGNAPRMGISVSILLIAVGAILTWAVTATTNGIDINTVGVILLVVGLLGLVLSMLFWSSWGGFNSGPGYAGEGGARRRGRPARRTTVVEEDDVVDPPA